MENISHVNRYFFLRIFLFPFVFLIFIWKLFKIYFSARKYVLKGEDPSVYLRYNSLFSIYSLFLFLKNVSFSFFDEKKIPKTQTVFIVNERFSWNSIALIKRMIKDNNSPLVTYFLKLDFLKKYFSIILDLIDVVYYKSDAEKILEAKRSLIFESDFFLLEDKNIELVHKNMFTLTPIYFQTRKKILSSCNSYIFGTPIKVHEIAHLEKKAFELKLEDSFEKLRKKLDDYEKNSKKFSFKSFFYLKEN